VQLLEKFVQKQMGQPFTLIFEVSQVESDARNPNFPDLIPAEITTLVMDRTQKTVYRHKSYNQLMESILEVSTVFHYLCLSSNYSNLVIDSTTMWKTKGAIALALMVMLCLLARKQTRGSCPGTGNVTTEEVADNTNALLGKTVTIRSEPVKNWSKHLYG